MTWDCLENKLCHHCIKVEFQKTVNFLDTTSDDKDLPRFVTKKCVEVYDQSGGNYDSDLCDFLCVCCCKRRYNCWCSK